RRRRSRSIPRRRRLVVRQRPADDRTRCRLGAHAGGSARDSQPRETRAEAAAPARRERRCVVNIGLQINKAMWDLEQSVRIMRGNTERSHNGGARAERALKLLPANIREARRHLYRLETLLEIKRKKGGAS